MTITDMFAGTPATTQAPYEVTAARLREFRRALRPSGTTEPDAPPDCAPPTFAAAIVQPVEARTVAELGDSSPHGHDHVPHSIISEQ
jgi:hypothetical protein